MHDCKDVPKAMADAARGEETGVACSDTPIGCGANAGDIQACVNDLKQTKWNGVFSIETLGTPGNIRDSVTWLRSIL